MALGSSMLGGASGNLGTLWINLKANATGVVTGMKTAEKAVATSSTKMLGAARKMSAGIIAAFAAVAIAGVVQYSQFEKQMVKSTAIMTDVTIGLRNEMESTARFLATTSVTSAEELAEAYFFLASAGLSAKQSIAALDTVNTFAIAGQFDMATATDLLTDAQSALGLVVEDTTQNMINMTRVSDVLVKANTLANATVQQFSAALTREAGAAMKSFTMDVEEGVAVLAAFADQGIKGEIAGTSFSRILRLMTAAAVNNKEAYEDMNIEVFDTTGNLANMADIIGDLESALGDMSDEARTAALDQLGFKARVQGVILPLLGTSEAVRQYEKDLRRAGGTSQRVADKQMKAFSAQLKITWNRLKDMLLTIGKELVPVLRIFNTALQELTGTHEGLNEASSTWALSIAPVFLTMIGLIGDAIWGWKLIIASLRVAFSTMAEGVQAVFTGILKTIVFVMTEAILAFGKLQAAALAIPGSEFIIGKGIDTDALAGGFQDLKRKMEQSGVDLAEVTMSNMEELQALVDKGSFSDRLIAKYDAATMAAQKSAVAQVEAMEQIEEAAKESDLTRRTREIAKETINELFGEAGGLEGENGLANGSPLGMDAMTFQLQQFQAEQDLAEERLEELQRISDAEIDLDEDTQARKLALVELYNEQLKNLHVAQAQIILGSSEQMFMDMASIAEAGAGRQSAVFKGMFAASKAFAIANATIQIATGIANAAAAQPWFMAIPAIASVVAATAGIMSSIQSVQMEFGGAREKGGDVAAGKAYLVGEKGPELFSPNSNGGIIPNNALGGGGQVSVVINNFSDATARVVESNEGEGKKIEIIIEKTKNSLAGDIRNGTGAVNKSLQSSFGLKRAGA